VRDVYRPTLARIAASVGPERDLVQAYCDVLEEKWLLSEQEGRDIGLSYAIDAYLALGAPAPETIGRDDPTALLDPVDAEPDALAEIELLEPEPLDGDDDRPADEDRPPDDGDEVRDGGGAPGMAPSDT
jgi:hypothetical protein